MRCERCFTVIRVFGACVQCAPKPGSLVSDPVLRWFLDVLAEHDTGALTDAHVQLIRQAADGTRTDAHDEVHESWTAGQREQPREPAIRGRTLGTVGERFDFPELRCTKILPLGLGDYGERFLLLFETTEPDKRDRAQVVWFTGEGGKFDPKEGGVYALRANVKEHKVYGAYHQTVIQRPKERV